MNYTFNSSTLSNNSSLNTTGIVVPCFLHKYYCSTFHDYNKYLTHFYQTFISGASTLGIREVSPEYHRCSETNANLFITTPLQEFQTLSLWVQCSERPQTKQFKCQSKCVKRKQFFVFTTPPPPLADKTVRLTDFGDQNEWIFLLQHYQSVRLGLWVQLIRAYKTKRLNCGQYFVVFTTPCPFEDKTVGLPDLGGPKNENLLLLQHRQSFRLGLWVQLIRTTNETLNCGQFFVFTTHPIQSLRVPKSLGPSNEWKILFTRTQTAVSDSQSMSLVQKDFARNVWSAEKFLFFCTFYYPVHKTFEKIICA